MSVEGSEDLATEQDPPYGMPYRRETRYDPPTALMDMQAQPLRPMRYYPDGVEGWLVTGHAEGRKVLADPRFATGERFTHSPTELPHVFVSISEQVPPGFFLFFDPPEHTRLRRKVTGVFTVKRMKDLEPRIADIVDERINALRAAGPGADLVREFALPVPSLVICEMLGVPYGDREAFQRNSADMLDLSRSVEERNKSMAELFGYLMSLVPAKRADPGDDMLSALAADPDIHEVEAAGIALILLVAGHETTANMLALGTFALLEHPAQLARLRVEPELMPAAVEELLRYLSVAHNGIMRIAKEDAEIDGRLIRAGQHVTVVLQAANRDPHKYERPGELDLGRDAQGHMAFGHGVHQCVGQQLARVEMRIGFAKLIEAFPELRLAVPSEEIPMRSDMAVYGVHTLPVNW
ncbi:cytochrome P450 [Glycomyces algeriensis]|uniref:Cytochrome P450 n=1 Tax=Glycomyces algeriensis TaxID=256037 RepID=A0A9W6LFT7_9ACTN|nr:cytochrome P450 [Glycomyces algeriensis]MDA1368436.1 cytochrome P450 [Glycomyces algeriensis]MDR7353242.1 cytochrome P450 [Glycomyces algeriensis]GLI40936.1 cytochrome P450 [Glycomyces algeriensis]